MEETTTKQEFDEIGSMIEVSDRALFANDIKMENSHEVNGLNLYAWENKQLEVARVATAKAKRIHAAAFNLAKGGAK